MNTWMKDFIDGDPTHVKKIAYFTELVEQVTECSDKTNQIKLLIKDLIKVTEAGEVIRRLHEKN